MHEQFYQDLEKPSVDKENSLAWLYKGKVKVLPTTGH